MTHSLRYVLVGLLILAATRVVVEGQDASVYNDNVVIVLDGSGSMKEPMDSHGMTKMMAAKEALRSVLSQLPVTTQVGLLVFSSSTNQDWLYPLGPQDTQGLEAAIDSIRPGGGTPLGEYIKMGADRLLQQRAGQYGYGSYRLLIVTDGEARDGRLVDHYAGEVMARGVTIDVIGVKMKKDHTLATKAHSYRRADDPASLTKAIAAVMAEVSAADASDATGENAFEILAALPAEVAQVMVQSLAASGNHAIGETPSVQAQAGEGGRRTAPSATGGPPPLSKIDSNTPGIGAFMTVMGMIAIVAVGLAVWRVRSRIR